MWSVRWLLRYVTHAYISFPRPIFGITGMYWNYFTLNWEVITRGGDATAEVPLACSHADHERVLRRAARCRTTRCTQRVAATHT